MPYYRYDAADNASIVNVYRNARLIATLDRQHGAIKITASTDQPLSKEDTSAINAWAHFCTPRGRWESKGSNRIRRVGVHAEACHR